VRRSLPGVATLPAGLPVWLRWLVAAPVMAVALVGPELVFVLVTAADFPQAGGRTVLQAADALYGTWLFVFAWLVPGAVSAGFLWRQLLAWRRAYVIVVSLEIVPWLVSIGLYDATQRDATEPWIVPVALGIAVWLGGYLTAMLAIRILTAPGARLAASSLEMVVPLRRHPTGWQRHRGWLRIQWDRVRIEAGHDTGTAVMAWWAMESVQVGEFTGDATEQVTEIGSRLERPTLPLPRGAGVRMCGEPGTLYAACDEARAPVVAEAIAARVAWASRRPWTEGPDLGKAAATAGYEEGRDTLRNFRRFGITVRGVPALVMLSIVFGLGTLIEVFITVQDGQHHGLAGRSIGGDTILTTVIAGLDVYTLHQLRNYLRGQRYLEANFEPVPDQPSMPWLGRGEPIVVRPHVSENPDEPFVTHTPVRSARRGRRPHGRRHR
jgi:hypothetical protein